MSGLIWIQTVWHSDGIPERTFWKNVDSEINQQMTKNMQNYPVGKVLYTVKPVLNDHWKIDKNRILMTNGSLMKVESIAEGSIWSILQYFWPALSDI